VSGCGPRQHARLARASVYWFVIMGGRLFLSYLLSRQTRTGVYALRGFCYTQPPGICERGPHAGLTVCKFLHREFIFYRELLIRVLILHA
jgi:hypothetical protein